MDARIATTMSDLLGRLPADGAGRDLALQRLTDMYAAAEASSAVHAAAGRIRGNVQRVIVGADETVDLVLVALLLIFGSQFTLFAMWFDMESNKELK